MTDAGAKIDHQSLTETFSQLLSLLERCWHQHWLLGVVMETQTECVTQKLVTTTALQSFTDGQAHTGSAPTNIDRFPQKFECPSLTFELTCSNI